MAGADAAGRIDKLIMSNTACYIPDKSVWENRIKFVRERGWPMSLTAHGAVV